MVNTPIQRNGVLITENITNSNKRLINIPKTFRNIYYELIRDLKEERNIYEQMDVILDKYIVIRFFNSQTADTTQTRKVNRIAVFVNPRYI
jgi:hypothetical protein